MPGPRRIALNENYFDVIDTPEKAYWLGFLVTDGSVYSNDINIRLGEEDTEHLHKFVSALGSGYPVEHKVNNFGRSYAEVEIHCLHMVRALARHGVMRGKPNNQPWDGPAELLPHYWRGAVDGDGWLSLNPVIVGYCGSAIMVDAFIAFAESVIPPEMRSIPLSKITHRNIFQATYGGAHVAPALCRALRYDNLSVPALDRKRERAFTILATVPKQKAPNRTLSDGSIYDICLDWNTGEYTTQQLAEKYSVGKGTIYNIVYRKSRYADMVLPDTMPMRAARQS